MYLIPKTTPGTTQGRARQNASNGASHALALNWLEGHLRIMGFWMERLVSENGDTALIDALHRQSKWLEQMTQKLGANP